MKNELCFLLLFLVLSVAGSASPTEQLSIEPHPPAIVYPQWTFFDGQRNKNCILVQMELKLFFNYMTKDNKMSSESFIVPNEKTVHAIEGMCAPLLQNIKLAWGQANESTVLLQFTSNPNATEYWLSEVKIDFNASGNIENAATNQTLQFDFKSNNMFNVPMNYYYYCTTPKKFEVKSAPKFMKIGITNIEFLMVRLQAFYEDNNSALQLDPHYTDFFKLCAVDQHNFMIALIVMGTVLLLIAVAAVVFSYIRSYRARGYAIRSFY